MGRHFDEPFSFAVTARTRQGEIIRDQRNKICLERPHVQQIDRFYRDFFLVLKIKKQDISSKKRSSVTRETFRYSPP